MVLVFSSSANASPQIRREVERAVNKGIPIVPFKARRRRDRDRAPPDPFARSSWGSKSPGHGARPQASGRGHRPGRGAREAARPAPPPPAPIGLFVAFGVLLLVALAALVFTHGPSAPKTAAALPPTAAPAAAPTNPPAALPAVASSTVSAASSAAVSSDASSARRPPKVRATYENRRGVKFSIDPDKAVVTMDGKRIGISEDFYHRAYNFSRSGTHYAKLSLRGYRTDWVKIVVRSGAEDENADIKLELRRAY